MQVRPPFELVVAAHTVLRRLQIVLSTGNWLNGGTPQGRAHGFALEFLSKVPSFFISAYQ
jgi:hypothetical protein